tara:strand:+ start:287 stop:502 length:216 start_codon:yes stop_codon:yes gene_type:complete
MNSILIGIAGGTGSGKTSLAKGILADYSTGEVTVLNRILITKTCPISSMKNVQPEIMTIRMPLILHCLKTT